MTNKPSHHLTFNRKAAIVTGAARGIGRAIATLLAQNGISVLLQDIDGNSLQETHNLLRSQGYAVQASVGDISKVSDVHKTIAQAMNSWGNIGLLVNNAGIGGVGKTVAQLEVNEWQQMLDVNLTGVFLNCRAVLPHMIAQKSGAIINIASITGQIGIAGSAPYAAAKAGVIAFSKSLAKEVAPHQINVNVVAPGLIDTDMSRARGIDHQRHLVAWPRIGVVDDVAWAVAYLASDQAEFVTGTVLNVNGGAYM